MTKTAVVLTCAHASPEVSNERFTLLGKFLYDLRPDYVVDLGDGADMKSLNSYDTRKPKALVAQSYEADINHYNDSQERIRHYFRKNKRKRPAFYGFEGNHEHRIAKAIETDPRLEGTKFGISFSHLNTNKWFDEYHEYINGAPAIRSYDGVSYAHFIASGNYGSALSSVHHGHALVHKLGCSTTVGHSHKFHFYRKAESRPYPTQGLVAGCFKGADEAWAGQANREWTKGVVIKRGLEHGNYDLQWVSLAQLQREYG
jgi:hypothetical protein